MKNLTYSLRMYKDFNFCRTYCVGHRYRSFSQQRFTESILSESVFAVDLASISYIESEESPAGHGSSPPKYKKTLKLCGFKVFLLPKNRNLQRLNFILNSEHSRGTMAAAKTGCQSFG